MTRYTLSWPWSARVYSASLCGRRSRVRVRWLVPSPWRPCPCPAPPAARRLLLASQSCGALPCLVPALFSLFYFIDDAPKGHGFGLGIVSVSCCCCPVLCVSCTACRGCGKWPRRFSFFFGSLRPNGSRRIGSKSKRPPSSCGWRYDFPCSHPTGTTDRRRTSARVVTVPFLHNNPVRAAFLKPFSAN